ncbi:MAG: Kelch repeat-containing protein [Candidatus Thorarchaeota archaeon]
MKKRTIQAVLLAVLIVTLLQTPVAAVVDGTWTEMSPTVIPPTRCDLCFVYDSESDVAILFGGTTGPVTQIVFNDTWAYDYDSDTWTNKSPSVAPSARLACQYAYDSESDKFILFSGAIGGTTETHFNDTWAYDYDTNTWTELSPSVMPDPRRYGCMAYDSESDRIILFGGIHYEGGTIGDTWAYDYNTNTWEEMSPSVAPSSRFYPVMAYDSESDKIILFSGAFTSRDTWAYDYNTNTWENMNPETEPDDGVAHMAYDSEKDLCVLFGGLNEEDEVNNVTWTYDYNSNMWSNASVSTCPCARERGALVYDIESDVTVLYGGMGPGNWDELLNDTWSLELSEPTTTPPPDWGPFILVTVGVGVVIVVLVVFIRRR